MKEKRVENRDLLDAVKRMPCCACLKHGPSDPHHIKTVKSGGPDEIWNVVSLCRSCHQSIHVLALNRFTDKYPYFKEVITKKGWSYDDYRGKWTHENA